MNRKTMLEILDAEEKAVAAKYGWQLCRVFDLAKRAWAVQILPLSFNGLYPSADHAGAAVVASARKGSLVSIKALRLVAASALKQHCHDTKSNSSEHKRRQNNRTSK